MWPNNGSSHLEGNILPLLFGCKNMAWLSSYVIVIVQCADRKWLRDGAVATKGTLAKLMALTGSTFWSST